MKVKEINENNRMNKYLYQEGLDSRKRTTLKLDENDSSFKDIDIISKLLKMGYELDCLNRAYSKYKFKTIEQALLILNKDEEKDKFTHTFLDVKGKKNCGICNNPKDSHLDYCNPEYQIDNSGIPLQCTTFMNNTNHLVTEYQSNQPLKSLKIAAPEKPIIKKLTIQKIRELEGDFNGKNLCLICFESELFPENIFRRNSCGHSVCMKCMKTYLGLRINESNIENIYCLHPGCKQVITDDEVRYCVDMQIYSKYKKFKRRLLYLNNKNKGFVPCPFPNCEEYVPLISDSINIICDIGHAFCSKCMERVHQGDCSYVNLINFSLRLKG
jgi:hypothetical protein